jgi:hypothetical protein
MRLTSIAGVGPSQKTPARPARHVDEERWARLASAPSRRGLPDPRPPATRSRGASGCAPARSVPRSGSGSVSYLGMVPFPGQARRTRPLSGKRVTSRLVSPHRAPGRALTAPGALAAPVHGSASGSAASPFPGLYQLLPRDPIFLSLSTRQIRSKRTRKWSKLIGRRGEWSEPIGSCGFRQSRAVTPEGIVALACGCAWWGEQAVVAGPARRRRSTPPPKTGTVTILRFETEPVFGGRTAREAPTASPAPHES